MRAPPKNEQNPLSVPYSSAHLRTIKACLWCIILICCGEDNTVLHSIPCILNIRSVGRNHHVPSALRISAAMAHLSKSCLGEACIKSGPPRSFNMFHGRRGLRCTAAAWGFRGRRGILVCRPDPGRSGVRSLPCFVCSHGRRGRCCAAFVLGLHGRRGLRCFCPDPGHPRKSFPAIS